MIEGLQASNFATATLGLSMTPKQACLTGPLSDGENLLVLRRGTYEVTSTGHLQREGPGAGRFAVCGLLTAVGVLVAAGAAFTCRANRPE